MKLLSLIAFTTYFIKNTLATDPERANYPLYIQVFPYDPECSGNVSFIANPPVTDGKGAYSYLENVSSVLAVPAKDDSVTCLNLNKTLPTCFKGNDPRCFQMSSPTNRFTLSINDSSHPVKASSKDYTTGFRYMLTPNITFEYVHNSTKKSENHSTIVDESFLYECHGNKSCEFNLRFTNKTLGGCSDAKTCLQSGKGGAFDSVDKLISTIYDQVEKNGRRTDDSSYISPKLKTISKSKSVNITKIDVSASPSSSKSASSGSSSSSSSSASSIITADKSLVFQFTLLTLALLTCI
ncbi:uncharacterized protein SOCG_02628 [Schizosaccharomyces octosporus yFS286]|uniref:Uncharacterized protein n=1 Tax=Schizosaccharomyces octosporus (strain yFS286) TaxID=483514 RepID=S9Q112_SCHOY|nr:uncharacterized protein SOCG_02628 [Schizosaccharomyces octosporus yFS286]EPX73403.1 hypothetical protein SOCG_02628 [Schizosaccharomyces octosporus yFS286]